MNRNHSNANLNNARQFSNDIECWKEREIHFAKACLAHRSYIQSLIVISGITAVYTFDYFFRRRNGVSGVETARPDPGHDGGPTQG
jgi:hypothetical protein